MTTAVDRAQGRTLPLPVGMMFHVVYVTFWSVVFIQFFPKRNFAMAMALAGALWVVVLVVFFPVIGREFAGLDISPRMIPASFVPHFLFGLFLWALETHVPRETRPAAE